MIFTVAIPSPLRRRFDYLPPLDQPQTSLVPGIRVRVPFGRQTLVGILLEAKETSAQPAEKLKAILDVIDTEPLINGQLLQLFLWAADYYQHPVGDALLSTLPAPLRKGRQIPIEYCEAWQLTSHGLGLADSSLARAKKQQQLLQLLRDHNTASTEALKTAGFSSSIIKTLKDKGLIAAERLPAVPEMGNAATDSLLREPPLQLREEQHQALDSLEFGQFTTYLLFGDTGTGKTEVYLQAIAQVLAQGRQALVLVPEINLTPQTLARFQRRFRCEIAAMHSGLSDRQRLQSWADARSGKARIVIGTRSAIFTPLATPGIIIIDEEHDTSFKQQEGFRYSARDVAVMRASREAIPVVLGSATPSLESLVNCERGRYKLLQLRHSLKKPAWQRVDLRGTQLNAGFSAPVIQAIGEELKLGNQVLVFLNRRGYAPLLLCHDCGWQAECPQCSAKMTTHLRQQRLICHYCERQQPIPSACQHCHSPRLQFVGQGTERSEEVLGELFPDARIIRLDRDSTRRKNAMADAIEEIRRDDPCIIVGTQMIAKGHHFPGVTLAALLEVDSGLFSADFRATEKMAQMITQVAGRAGRGDNPGKVVIQSHYVDHPLLMELLKGDYRQFASLLLAERRNQLLPPYCSLAIFRAEALDARSAEAFLSNARQLLEKALPPSPDFRYLGPLPAALQKRQGYHRLTLSLFASQRTSLGSALATVCQQLETAGAPGSLRWSVDVDPQESG